LGEAPADAADWSGATVIADLEVISALRQEFYEDWPAGWKQFIGAVEKIAVRDQVAAAAEPVITVINGREVSYSSDGPVIVNGGYAPGWQVRGESGRRVRQVSPALMYVDGSGATTLIYGRTATDRAALLLSIAAALGLAWYALGPTLAKRLRRRGTA
jgi:uncharacterized membrane protein